MFSVLSVRSNERSEWVVDIYNYGQDSITSKFKKVLPHNWAGVLRREVSTVKALDGIDLDIYRGECLGVVGESGCGKTTTGKAIIRLHDPTAGHVYYYAKGQSGEAAVDIAQTKKSVLKNRGIRAKLQMVFQDPTTSLESENARQAHYCGAD